MIDASNVTIRDVARVCGVSTATVSNYLNHPERVRGATAERIAEAVAELGYEPNTAAVDLSRERWARRAG